jgi:hypothetical protein
VFYHSDLWSPLAAYASPGLPVAMVLCYRAAAIQRARLALKKSMDSFYLALFLEQFPAKKLHAIKSFAISTS